MASNTMSKGEHAESSDATVEIKIKTLDSKTYTLRVNKCVSVPVLKEQVAAVTGILSEQQRLICRGKVLKDDQLLSAYHVEDGHALHLVVRQPLPPFETISDNQEEQNDGHGLSNQLRPSVFVGSFNVTEQGENGLPDLGRIVSAVLSSLGVGNIGGGSEGADIREHLRVHGLGGLTNSSRQQLDQTPTTAVPLQHLTPLEIPDSLITLSQYLSHMRHEFSNTAIVTDLQEANILALHAAVGQGGLPTPTSLAEVLLSTQQLLVEQAAECLSRLARQLNGHTTVTDPSARMIIQSNGIRSGDFLQKLGALLFELGRTTMTLRMGQAPADAVVNAGPALFISSTGPNPIMVQPQPFQLGSSFGSGISSGLGSAFLPRNIDIRIHTDSLMPTVNPNQGELVETQQSQEQNNPAVPAHANSVNQSANVPPRSHILRDPEVRILPIRTVVRAPSDLSRGSVGILYPVLARVQNATNGNLDSTGGSQISIGLDMQQHPNSESTARRENSTSSENGDFPTRVYGRFNQLLRTIFPGEQIEVGEGNIQDPDSTSVAEPTRPVENVIGEQDAALNVTDDGLFLSNMLRQIIPLIPESISLMSNENTENLRVNAHDPSTQETSEEVGTSLRRPTDHPNAPNSKRHKRE